MNVVQNSKNRNLDKPFPGCLGRMVNLFDLNSGVSGNKLLTEKPHRDGSLSRSNSDVTWMSSNEIQIQDKEIVSQISRDALKTKVNGTPMKMHLAKEMSKDISSKYSPPSVVAKLMGLDAFPSQPQVSTMHRDYSGGHEQSAEGNTTLNCCHHRSVSLDTEVGRKYYQYPEHSECKDVYEVWHSQQETNPMRSKLPQKGRFNETSNDKKAAFVRQKFIEAKCLSVDEKCHDSKKFHEALEVLSSNTDLFLKFLQEPRPNTISERVYNLQSIPAPETKRITVLKPSKMLDNCKFVGTGKNENVTKGTSQVGQVNRIDKPHPDHSDNSTIQPTRIVVLKPSTVKYHELNASSSPPSQGKKFFGVVDEKDARESREVAKSITRQMRESLAGHRRDETLLSSVFSNGYVGDESSFNKSESECAAMNLSDSEVMSPLSRHSWDYINNKFNSPYSISSLSRASYSPESSVSREAKKRLSERWAMVASNRSHQEQRHPRRSSSTLGEMLALSDAKKSGTPDGEGNEEVIELTSCSVEDTNMNDVEVNLPKNLLRSKSVPTSSTTFASQLNMNVPDLGAEMTGGSRDKTKERSTKSSLKGKVSSLFFSRNKRNSETDESPFIGNPSSFLTKVEENRGECIIGTGVECSPPDLHGLSGEASSPDFVEKQGLFASSESVPSLNFGNLKESHEQPSPVSVLETFEEDGHSAKSSLGNIKPYYRSGEFLPHQPIGSNNLIDKSPPIGSIARTLSWDDSCVDAHSHKLAVSTCTPDEEEREWFFFIQTLLSVAGLDEVSRWHSPDSPLDPLLRDTFIGLNESLHEAKRRQRRSTRKLVFDCVNAALMDMAGHARDKKMNFDCDHNTLSVVSADRVWERIKGWFVNDGEDTTANDLAERMLREEVVGKRWSEHSRMELESVGREIEARLLEEIVEDAVVELAASM
ncbi:unnamed protein product [Cuscuta campestris]|uniref:DUF4378 domain-containing protein n=1 Tax=Cuscuta campestris TaxID=132261 RepID=A0A484MDV3_9ASTE|nr:unnamed protein product [Cuscuta campestris]